MLSRAALTCSRLPLATPGARLTKVSLPLVALRTHVAPTLARRPLATLASPSSPSATKIAIGVGAAAGVVTLGLLGSLLEPSSLPGASADSLQTKWPADVRQRVQDTFACFGLGLVATAGSAALVWRSGLAHKLMVMNPFAQLAISLGTTLGSLVFLYSVPKENRLLKAASFGLFNASISLGLAPLAMLGGNIVLQAAGYTGAIVGSMAWVGANAPTDQYLWLAAPLSMGLGAVVVASLGSMFLPVTSTAGSMLYKFSLYGGLGLFSLFVLYDTTKIVEHAYTKGEAFDPYTESVGIYLDAINIFVRMASILANNRSKK